MATPWRLIVVPVALVAVLAACGSDNTASPNTTPAPSSPAVSGTSPSPASTGDTAAPTASSIDGASDEIIVHVGVDDAATTGSRVENVKLGENVILRLTSDSDEDYHVHGYDIEQKVAAGVEAQFEFKADMAGDFEVESHVTQKVYVVLHVS
jgi:heme/copper-type cytochrome/quinol oxidase subunit 2